MVGRFCVVVRFCKKIKSEEVEITAKPGEVLDEDLVDLVVERACVAI